MRGEERTGSVSGLMKLQWDCNLDLISKDKFYKVTVPFERGIESGVIFYNSVQNLEYAKSKLSLMITEL